MSEKRPWASKSAAHRFGLVHCPSCNPAGLPAMDISNEIQCAWCWNNEERIHYRYVKTETLKKWRKDRGLPEDDEDEIETSPQARSALSHPPPLSGDTLPSPGFKPPIKREEDE